MGRELIYYLNPILDKHPYLNEIKKDLVKEKS